MVNDEDDKEFFKKSSAEKIFWRLLRNLEESRKEDASDKEEEGEEEGEEGDDNGDNEDGGEGDPGGDTPGGDQDTPLKPGNIIQDHATGQYGRVTSVQGDDVDWDEISKEEALKEIE